MTGDVGIRELKANLSSILAEVERGHRIRVTDRGRPKVMLIPISIPDRLDAGSAEGWVTQGIAGDVPMRSRQTFDVADGVSVDEIIQQDRGQ